MNNLLLPSKLVRQIEHEGSTIYPNECCGIIYGKDGPDGRVVDELEAVPNVFDETEKYHRFSISPQQLMRAEQKAGNEGKLVLGFYHSHPDHPARPSEYDRQHAWPFYSYVIVSIGKGEPLDMTCWVLDDTIETFAKQEIVETK
ncbi:MAG TPA: M67 family metallopeptidase [Tepidisphaeraceae bacterium]|nr:M67 family metallopeptidase [Tepidisphaeraceae bacterium]